MSDVLRPPGDELSSEARPDHGVWRTEEDSLGSLTIHGDRLFGINSQRAFDNFAGCGAPLGSAASLVRAFARIKWAAARANFKIGALPADIADAIERACAELVAGQHMDEFVVPLLEGSGGTSTNMNINEVIANKALQLLGATPGDYFQISPNDHVNLGQSTNDTYPSALKLALHEQAEPLVQILSDMRNVLERKAEAEATTLKVGRTCAQPAQPMFVGQTLGGYASALSRAIKALEERRQALLALPLGGTAIGTGLGTAEGYASAVFEELKHIYGPVSQAQNPFDGLQFADEVLRFSAELRNCSQIVAKIGADFILLASGPSGLDEISIPNVQAGSSIMPGKVNPVLPMLVQQVSFVVLGNDAATSAAAQAGQFEINHFEPVMAKTLLESLQLMTSAYRNFVDKCLDGLEAKAEPSYQNLLRSSALASVFLHKLGYREASRVVRLAENEQRSFADVAVELGLLEPTQIRAMLTSAAASRSSASQPC